MGEDERKPSGCGLMVLYNGIFRRKGGGGDHSGGGPPRRSNSLGSLPTSPTSIANALKKRSGSSDQASMVVSQAPPIDPPRQMPVVSMQRGSNGTRIPPQQQHVLSYQHKQQQVVGYQQQRQQGGGPGQGRGTPLGLSGELDSVIYDHQRVKGPSTLVRASSSNVMLFGDLGNLGGGGRVTSASNTVLDYLPKTSNEKTSERQRGGDAGRSNGTGINGVRNEVLPPPSLCRALSKRLDPEELKEMGNEEYKRGRYAEALALYDRAIAMDPDRASYWSNKAAALTGLGRLLEAVAECREAVRIDPAYKKAHHRLATLYLRLGEADKAQHYYKQSGNEATAKDMSQAQKLQTHLSKMNEARRMKDWKTALSEAESAVSWGADFAPQVFAAQAEALLKLQRNHEADAVMIDAPTFDTDEATKFFGAQGNAYVISVRAQIYMAAGRFDEAVSAAQMAARIDPGSKDIAVVARKTRAVASARSKGNDLFKAGRFAEACIAYGEGLDQDSRNSVLLCNRAACRIKLSQFDKAIEDCNLALDVKPSYSKARLRRADCYLKMEKWKQALEDYQVLNEELPGDEEVKKGLSTVQMHIQKQADNTVNEKKIPSEVVGNKNVVEPSSNKTEPGVAIITSDDQFMRIVSSHGATVALFVDGMPETEQMMPSMERLKQKYPAINFLMVDNEGLIKSEGVHSLPTFRTYQNDSRINEIAGCDWKKLENFIQSLKT